VRYSGGGGQSARYSVRRGSNVAALRMNRAGGAARTGIGNCLCYKPFGIRKGIITNITDGATARWPDQLADPMVGLEPDGCHAHALDGQVPPPT